MLTRLRAPKRVGSMTHMTTGRVMAALIQARERKGSLLSKTWLIDHQVDAQIPATVPSLVFILTNFRDIVLGRVENHFDKTTSSTPDKDSNLDLPVIGSLVYCESSALDHAATKVGGGSRFHPPLTSHVCVCLVLTLSPRANVSYSDHLGRRYITRPCIVTEPLGNGGTRVLE
uniref:Uncharacterized protein n=1 Tax=Timema tahoe TaxID=61484 RepID=A0A7R9IH12_9NEOP|nr:unnamed protein product [Timema tahoe]